jgi:hypothetical protein
MKKPSVMQFFSVFVLFLTIFSNEASAKLSIRDSHIAKYIKQGQGGLIVQYNGYKIAKNANLTELKSKYANWGDLIKNEASRFELNPIQVYFLSSADGTKDIGVVRDPVSHQFLFMAPPGEYYLSRVTFRFNSELYSQRIFGKVTIEPGKIKYIGDIVSVIHNNDGKRDLAISLRYAPDDFQAAAAKWYPLSSALFVPEKLVVEEEK